MQTKKDEIQEDETPAQLHERIEKLTKGLLSDRIDSVGKAIREDHKRKLDRVNKTKKSKPQSYVSISNIGNNNGDTSEVEFMQELLQAKKNIEETRATLNKLIDQKLSEHSMSYYIREKGIGSKSIQELKYHRDRMHLPTLIHNLEKMI